MPHCNGRGRDLSFSFRFIAVQVAAYCLSALAGGIMFCRWLQVEEEERRRVWRLYHPHMGFYTPNNNTAKRLLCIKTRSCAGTDGSAD